MNGLPCTTWLHTVPQNRRLFSKGHLGDEGIFFLYSFALRRVDRGFLFGTIPLVSLLLDSGTQNKDIHNMPIRCLNCVKVHSLGALNAT